MALKLAGRHGLIWLLLLSVCNTVWIDRESTARGITIVTNGRGECTSGFWLAPRAHRRDIGRSSSVLFAHQILMRLRGGGDAASRSKLSDDNGWDNFAAPASSMRAGPLQMTWGMATEEETVTKSELHDELKEYREVRKEEQQRTNKGRLEKETTPDDLMFSQFLYGEMPQTKPEQAEDEGVRILAEGIARQSKKEKQRKLHEKLLSRENGGVSQGTSTEDGQGQESGGQGSSGAQQPFVRRPDLSELEWQRSWFGPRIADDEDVLTLRTKYEKEKHHKTIETLCCDTFEPSRIRPDRLS